MVREVGRVISMVLVVAIGVRETGERVVLGIDLGPSEDGAFWQAFLRSLVDRGLTGVQLVISDAHQGLKEAVGAVFTGVVREFFPRSEGNLQRKNSQTFDYALPQCANRNEP